LKKIQGDIADEERILKALIRSLEKRHLNPWVLESLNPFYQLNWRRTTFDNIYYFSDNLVDFCLLEGHDTV